MKNWSAVGRVHVGREYQTVVWCRERKKERGKECWRHESCSNCWLLVWETVQLDHGIYTAHPINGYWLSMLWNEDVGVGHGVSSSTLVVSYNQKWMKNIKKIFKEHTFGPNNAFNVSFGPVWTLMMWLWSLGWAMVCRHQHWWRATIKSEWKILKKYSKNIPLAQMMH